MAQSLCVADCYNGAVKLDQGFKKYSEHGITQEKRRRYHGKENLLCRLQGKSCTGIPARSAGTERYRC